jgi:hypothetical protein
VVTAKLTGHNNDEGTINNIKERWTMFTFAARARRAQHPTLIVAGLTLLSACQSHLPSLDDYPTTAKMPKPPQSSVNPKPDTTPKVTDVVGHIQCELARILNTKRGDAPGDTNSVEFLRRLANNPDIQDDLVSKLVAFNFVATIQLSLEVTDVEGLNPSLTFQNALMGLHTGTLAGQWNGTQDRNITLNYSVDLARLSPYKADFCAKISTESGEAGIQGDLGIADIVVDGLLSLDRSAPTNVYANAGPSPAPVAIKFARKGEVDLPHMPEVTTPTKLPEEKARPLTFQALRGTLLFAPQSAGVQTQGTVNFSGIATIDDQQYLGAWTGSILLSNAVLDPKSPLYFTLSGPLVPDPSDAQLADIEHRWGFNPTVTLTGTIDRAYEVPSIKLAGIIAPVAQTQYARATDPIRVTLDQDNPDYGPPNAQNPAAKGASPASSGGGTSFGSLVDFVLVYGLNGSPAFTWTHLKAITGMSSPFAAWMRTKTDSMAITFVAACRNTSPATPDVNTYWDSIGICDQLAGAQEVSAGIGYQNNDLMILRNFLVRPQ